MGGTRDSMGRIIENNLVVRIDQVKPNDFNPKPDFTQSEELKTEFEKLKESLRIHGQADPIQVREVEGDIPYEIINGEHRWLAMKELGFEKIEVKNLGKLTREEAIKHLLSFEELRIPLDVIEVAKILQNFKNSNVTIEGLPYLQQEIDDKIALLEFNFGQYDNKPPTLGNLPITFSFICTQDQLKIIRQAIDKCKEEAQQDISEGRIFELICIEFINMPKGQHT